MLRPAQKLISMYEEIFPMDILLRMQPVVIYATFDLYSLEWKSKRIENTLIRVFSLVNRFCGYFSILTSLKNVF